MFLKFLTQKVTIKTQHVKLYMNHKIEISHNYTREWTSNKSKACQPDISYEKNQIPSYKFEQHKLG